MAKSNIKGIVVEIGGNTTKLDQALKGVNKTSKDLQSELRQVNKALKFDPGNTTLLQQKQKLLAEAISNTKSKLDVLKEAERQAEQQFQSGKLGEEKYRALQREVIKTEQELKGLETQASSTELKLNKISSTAEKLGSVSNNIASKTRGLSIALTGVGTVAVKSASDLNETISKTEAVFKENSDSVLKWSKTTLDQFGLSQQSALAMASNFADMGESMGVSSTKAMEMAKSITGLTGDMSSYHNVSNEIAQTAMNSIWTGETESLKQFGIVMTQTNLNEFARQQGITKTIDKMTQAEQVELRYAYVMEKTKNAQGDFARTGDQAANSMRVAQESLKQAAAVIGQNLLPVVAEIATKISELAKSFSNLSPAAQKVILVVVGLVAAISPLASLISGISTITVTLIKGFTTFNTALKVVKGTATATTTGVKLLASAFTFITSSTGIVVVAITALASYFIYLWNTSEGFRNFWIGLWENIKNIVSECINGIGNFITVTIPNIINSIINWFAQLPGAIGNWLVQVINNVINWGSNMYNSAVNSVSSMFNAVVNWFSQLPGTIGNWLSNVVSNVISWGGSLVSAGYNAASQLVSSIVNTVSSIPSHMISIGKNIVQGIWNGIVGAKDWLWNKITGFASGIVDGFKSALGIHSPSRVLRDMVGKFIPQGIGVGIDLEMPNLRKNINSNLNDVYDGLRDMVDYETAKTTAKIASSNLGGFIGDVSTNVKMTPQMSGISPLNLQQANATNNNNNIEVVVYNTMDKFFERNLSTRVEKRISNNQKGYNYSKGRG